MATTAQIAQTVSIRLSQADILTLHSNPIVIVPGEPGFINIFQSATVTYFYKNTVFTNVSDLFGFLLQPTQPDVPLDPVPPPLIVSNTINGESMLGTSQITSNSFIPVNPYPGQMSKASMVNAPLMFGGAIDPLGGDQNSTLTIIAVYTVLAQ